MNRRIFRQDLRLWSLGNFRAFFGMMQWAVQLQVRLASALYAQLGALSALEAIQIIRLLGTKRSKQREEGV